MPITVIVNGKNETVPEKTTLLSYVKSKDLDPNTVVVEHNAVIIATGDLSAVVLKENDQLEILRFVGGG
jgi:sulfur carrier protein